MTDRKTSGKIVPQIFFATGKNIGFSLSDTDIYLWEWDFEKEVLTLSAELFTRLGYEDIEGFDKMDLYSIVHPDDLEANNNWFGELREGKLSRYEFEYRLRDAAGSYYWYYNRAKVVKRNSKGLPRIISGFSMDISSRYTGVLNRVEEERKFEFIFKNISQPVLIVKAGSEKAECILDANEAACSLLGYPLEELKKMNPEDYLVNHQESLPDQISRILSGEHVKTETRILVKGDKEIPVEVTAYKYELGQDNLIVAIVADLSEKIRVREQLEKSEARFESLFRNASMGIALLEKDLRIIVFNDAFKKVLPTVSETGEGMAIGDLLPELKTRLEECAGNILSNKEFHCSFSPCICSGSVSYWYSITLSPVKDRNGRVDYIVFTIRDITLQKELESNLRESEKLYRNLIQEAEDRIGLFNLDRTPVIMNSAFANVLGYSVEEFMEIDEMELIHPDDRKLLESREAEFYAKGEMTNEYRIRHKNGHYLCMFSKMVIIRGEGGEEDRILSIVRDITERQKTVRKLKESEIRFRHLIGALPDSILQVDRNGVVNDFHFASGNPLTDGKPDVTGWSLAKLFPQSLLEKLEAGIAGVLRSGQSDQLEYECEIERNKYFFEIRVIWFNEHEVLLIIHDITFRQESEAAVRESESKYRALVEAADDRIALYDIKGKRILTNSSYYTQLGYTQEEYEQLPFGTLLHPGDRYLFKGLGFPLHLIEGKKQLVLEYRMQHKNGYLLDMMAKIVPVTDSKGTDIGYLEIVRDITPLKKVEQQLRIAKDKAEESDLLKSAFLANMSHEIRTPMNSIVGFANLLTNQGLKDETREEYVKRINRNSEQLLALISDIIDLAKIESKQLTIIRSRVMINNVMYELHNQFLQEKERLNKEEVSLILENGNPGEDLAIYTDYVRLTQILQNLLNNALKFTGSGEIRFGYRLVNDSKIVMFVSDTGIGIARDNYNIIFDQFRQVDGSQTRKFGGTGLGLAICKNLVDLMGGHIWVESELGKGSIFFVELPSGEKKESVSAGGKSIKAGISNKDLKIIVVDDNLDTQVLIMSVFREAGLSPQVAGSFEDLLALINAGDKPDLILLDVQLPGRSVEDILLHLKDLLPEVRIVAQTAFVLQEEKEVLLKEGFDSCISKPFDSSTLISVINNIF